MRRCLPVIRIAVLVLACAFAAGTRATVISTTFHREAVASIEVSDLAIDRSLDARQAGPAFATATVGAPAAPAEARASGRAEQLTMTANAEYDNRTFFQPDVLDFTRVHSQARLELHGVSQGRDITIDYFLPPGFLELRTNDEVPPGLYTQEARLRARLDLCSPSCDGGAAAIALDFIAELRGGYRDWELETRAYSLALAPWLSGRSLGSTDFSPLLHDLVAVTDSDPQTGLPLRTLLWEYPALSGTVTIGSIPAGQPFVLDYLLVAEVAGSSPVSGAAAAINDPLSLASFPAPVVRQADAPPVGLHVPGSGVLVLSGLLGVLALRHGGRQGRGRRTVRPT